MKLIQLRFLINKYVYELAKNSRIMNCLSLIMTRLKQSQVVKDQLTALKEGEQDFRNKQTEVLN